MTRQTTPEERSEFYRRHVRGASYEEIAMAYEVSLECVRYWCRKQAKGQGVQSQWHIPMRGALSQYSEGVRQQILTLRDAHPGWGPISIRLELERDVQFAQQRLPSRASIGRYLHSFPRFRRVPKKNGR